MPDEIWKPLPIKPFDARYSVSNFGRVRLDVPSKYASTRPASSFVRPHPNRGYLQVSLRAEGLLKSLLVHQLVAAAFLDPKPFPEAIVRHEDDNRFNNWAGNLIWGTHKDNAADRFRNGRTPLGESHHNSKLTENGVQEIRRLYASRRFTQQEIADQFGIDQTTVSDIVRRRLWRQVA
jgi:predicted XRE-type DNA-binding protein